MPTPVFTIGHSNHPQEYFLALLQQQAITALCDVRSNPYSRMNPQFNREELKEVLRLRNIKYVFLGKELGARSEDPSCYDQGRISYDRLSQTQLFQDGLERVQKGMREHCVAIMCAEKEPVECHRTILVARHLTARGLEVRHIHADGNVETHTNTLRRLANALNLRADEHHLFCSQHDLLVEAYHLQEQRIAYEPSETDSAAIPALKVATR
jgi:uncharacterized protein (DUF488 family)